MTLQEWIDESIEKYRTQPPLAATRSSANAFRMGVQRRVGEHLIGRSIWAREWDVLIVLDACRTDLWRDVAPEYDLPEGDTAWSNASCSIDWYRRNFTQMPERVADEQVGVVTANPFADHGAEHAKSADLRDVPLAHFRPLYETEWGQVETDPPIETVPPERVTDHAIDAWRRRDELGIDRLVVHYMQPHEPFIERPEWSYQDPDDNPVLKNLVTDGYEAGTSPWQAMIDSGEVSVDEFWPVYQANLRWVLDDVTARLLCNLDADAVISADHGNGLGEWGEWHHPPGAIGPAVRRVPWVRVRATDEETIQPDVDTQDGVEATVENRLQALGYRD